MTEHDIADSGGKQAIDAVDDEDLYAGLEDIRQVAPGTNPAQQSENPVSKPKWRSANRAALPEKRESPEELGKRTVLLANLHWWTTDAQVQNLCEAHGTVEEVEFFHEESTGKSKGLVRVTMGSAAEATTCCNALRGKVVDGRMLTVTVVTPVGKEAGPRRDRGGGPKQDRQAPRRFPEQAHSSGQLALPMPQGMHLNMPPLPPGMGIPMPPTCHLPVPGAQYYDPVYTEREAYHPHHKRPRR